jgi:hypothetical protein
MAHPMIKPKWSIGQRRFEEPPVPLGRFNAYCVGMNRDSNRYNDSGKGEGSNPLSYLL